jgi:predicted enzyme related to lactoylglutathione lyase/uncharacterized protein YndB with AHSA1/START domain
MFQGLATHKLPVADLAAARDWYADVLGVQPYFDEPFYVGFDVGGYELGLVPAEEGDRPGLQGGTVYWRVADVEAALARLTAAGASVVEVAQEVGGGIVVGAVQDPFGNRFGAIHNPHFAVPPLGATVVAERGLAAADGALAPVEIHATVTVPVAPMRAWNQWMSAEAVRGWLGAEANIEARIGGAWELFFMLDNPVGTRGGEGVRVLSFLPGRMISFTWNAPPEQPLTRPLHTWVVLRFNEVEGGTRVDLHHTGWPASGWTDAGEGRPESPWPETFAYFEAAWPRLMMAFQHGCGALSD